jgi:hypothetical protein
VRFVLAIVSFVLAAGMIGYGIAQRTVLLEPDQVAVSTVVTGGTAVIVVDGATLNAFPGIQTLSAKGDGKIFAAYGRTSDVEAWLGDTAYTKVGYDTAANQLTSIPVPGKESTVPDPAGSDLWFGEFVNDKAVLATVNVPADVSFLIISDGTAPAPANLRIYWPLDNSTPWAIPLIVGGAVVLLVGLVFLLWATNHMRSGRGPRRKAQKMPKVPRKRAIKPQSRKAIDAPVSGRRRGMIAVPVVLVGLLSLTGCAAVITPAASVPTPSDTAASPISTLDPPAATTRQVERIISQISAVTTKADTERDAKLLATRFTGAALELRLANYAIRGVDPSIAGLAAIPDGPVKLTLPQQTLTWPRTVFAVIQDDKDSKIPPVAVFLEQDDPRSAYKVSYAITLEPSVQLPDVAPANVGASRLAPDSGLLKLTPTDAAMAYGDILEKDVDSASYLEFDKTGDSLRTAVGLAYKQGVKASLPSTASVSFGHAIGPADAIALATNNAGAIVAVNLNEITTVKPVEAGAAVNPTGAVKALSGIAVSTSGVVATYGDQLLFFIPAAGSDGKIVLLGYSQGLVTAKEIK